MKTCLNLITLQKGLNTVEGIKLAAAAGFESVGIWADVLESEPDPMKAAADVASACVQEGISVSEMCFVGGWMWNSGDGLRDVLDQCKRRAEIAAAATCPIVIACASGGVGDLDAAAEDFRNLCDIGAAAGISFALEYIGMFEQVKDLATGLDIVRRAGHPNGKLLIDTFHSYRGGTCVEDFSLPRGDEVGLVHINDVPAGDIMQMNDSHRVMPGDGVLPLTESLRRLAENGFAGAVSVEVFSEAWWAKPLAETAAYACKALKSVMP
ncbi:MAG: sugar phosphate isomerase/epimerase [Armatimonadetes bacterium]|nr:sugar phosphate isomerase/epimerase [Armatimonadota bacterium]